MKKSIEKILFETGLTFSENLCDNCEFLCLQTSILSPDEPKTCLFGLHKDYKPIKKCKLNIENKKGILIK